MILFDYLLALSLYVIIYLITRALLHLFKKKSFWPLFSFRLLVNAITYTALVILFIGVLHIIFKKIDSLYLIGFDATLYLIVELINPYKIWKSIKNKEKVEIKRNHYLGASILVALLLECFLFNAKAYSQNKETRAFDNFICEEISVDGGNVEKDKIILSNKQCIFIKTNQNNYDNLYLSFDAQDMNLYVNIFEQRVDSEGYSFKKYALIDPAIDALGYISLDDMSNVKSLKIEFDIDDSRYFNNAAKPLITVKRIEFSSYFPLLINPIRLGGMILLIILGFNFKKLFIDEKVNENKDVIKRLEKIILFGGILIFTIFIIKAIVNNSAYFVKYDELYLGGTSSNNIYYQQFDAYVKGQLHLDVPVDDGLLALKNPYNPSARSGITYLWDHAFYNGKYYSYYGHAPIYLVMLPIFWVSGYVPSNMFVLQIGVISSIFAYLLAALKIFGLFIKKINGPFIILALFAAVIGSLLLANNTYEYGGMIYRIPYAYANGFLFLTMYLFIKGYESIKGRTIYFSFTALSLVFIVLSRPLQIIYLILFVPLIVKLFIDNKSNLKKLLIGLSPALSIVFVGAVLVCIMNYVRFESILEFGEHYQLTVTDCRDNVLDIDGILPTIYHFFIQPPKYNEANHLLVYRQSIEKFEYHGYNTFSVGIFFIPIVLLIVLTPYVLKGNDSVPLKILLISSPFVIFLVAFINYCFAGVCPRYLEDFTPWACIAGALVALKALEKDNGKHPVVPSLLFATLTISVVLSIQYHFVEFDGFRIGDFDGLLGYIKTIFNQYNI